MESTISQTKPTTSFEGRLTFGSILESSGIDPSLVLLIRHTYKTDGLTGPEDLTPEKIMAYVRAQSSVVYKFPKEPPRIWLNFIAAGGTRCRFIGAYENHGESEAERTETGRFYNLTPSDCLAEFRDRMVIDWGTGAINWAKRGESGTGLQVTEISDAQAEAFPGFDNLLLSFSELQTVIEDSRYGAWREVLKSVQGVYLIADTSTGQLYVGKADGNERILGRWSTYAKTGHGGNVALRELDALDLSHRRHFQFSILRVFSPGTSTVEIDAAEAHYKRAFLTRQFGLNRN
ncbi:GIY-YIG nuclease family protein [Paeniglutamicibacter sp. NPDC012692]|uniref:GIY-YIG nuclease family protein n=1 Tax=Paeniglutamicibacter sp. NPDC012692 TaxID=3364388 RepID=UPI0036B0FAD3